jgi:cell division septation protein DedD
VRRERFAARSGYFFLVLTGVAALPMTSNAADDQHQRNVHAHMHHTGLVHRRVQARPIALVATPAAVHMAAQLPDEQSTIIVTSPEPGAVVISTKPAPNTGEPAKPEPEADNPAKVQAHGPRGWIIQIGAFELETEARQHLSDAQLTASAVLAGADPFTEPVQRGDKVLYRARFAGFDKEAAEIACKQHKRGHFECMAIKD